MIIVFLTVYIVFFFPSLLIHSKHFVSELVDNRHILYKDGRICCFLKESEKNSIIITIIIIFATFGNFRFFVLRNALSFLSFVCFSIRLFIDFGIPMWSLQKRKPNSHLIYSYEVNFGFEKETKLNDNILHSNTFKPKKIMPHLNRLCV